MPNLRDLSNALTTIRQAEGKYTLRDLSSALRKQNYPEPNPMEGTVAGEERQAWATPQGLPRGGWPTDQRAQYVPLADASPDFEKFSPEAYPKIKLSPDRPEPPTVERARRLADAGAQSPHPMNYVQERKPTTEELYFFKSRPDVGGMATDDDAITINPYSALSDDQKDAVRLNERARVWMGRNAKPSFAITAEQARLFNGYGSEDDIRQTIAARILSGDSSSGEPTDEQVAWVNENLRTHLPQVPEADTPAKAVARAMEQPKMRAGLFNITEETPVAGEEKESPFALPYAQSAWTMHGLTAGLSTKLGEKIDPTLRQTMEKHRLNIPVLNMPLGEAIGMGYGFGKLHRIAADPRLGLTKALGEVGAQRAVEPLGFGAWEATEKQDPRAFVEGYAMGAAIPPAFRFAGRVMKEGATNVRRAAASSTARSLGLEFSGVSEAPTPEGGAQQSYWYTEPATAKPGSPRSMRLKGQVSFASPGVSQKQVLKAGIAAKWLQGKANAGEATIADFMPKELGTDLAAASGEGLVNAVVPTETAPGRVRAWFPEYGAGAPEAKQKLDAELNAELATKDVDAIVPGTRTISHEGYGEWEGSVTKNNILELPADLSADAVEAVAVSRAALLGQDAAAYFRPLDAGTTPVYVVTSPGVTWTPELIQQMSAALREAGGPQGFTAVGDKLIHLDFSDAPADPKAVFEQFRAAAEKVFGKEVADGTLVKAGKAEAKLIGVSEEGTDAVANYVQGRPLLQEWLVDLAEKRFAEVYRRNAEAFGADPDRLAENYLKAVRKAVGLPEDYRLPTTQGLQETARVSRAVAETVRLLIEETGLGRELFIARGGEPAAGALAQTESILRSKKILGPDWANVKGDKTVGPVAEWLERWVQSRQIFKGQDIRKVPDDQIVAKLYHELKAELKAWKEAQPEYKGFYDVDIPEANKEVQAWAKKEFGRELKPEEMDLFHFFRAASSPGATPVFDTGMAMKLLYRFLKTGDISGRAFKPTQAYKDGKPLFVLDAEGKPTKTPVFKPEPGKVSKAFSADSVDALNLLIKDQGSLAKAMEWMRTKQPVEEILRFMNKLGGEELKATNMPWHENLSRTEPSYGAFAVLNAKTGSYWLNALGNMETVTKDLWYGRQMARLTGQPLIDAKGNVVGEPWPHGTAWGNRLRKLSDQVYAQLAKETGVSPATIQQQLWDYEKLLWDKLGHHEPAATVSRGVELGKIGVAKLRNDPMTLLQKIEGRVLGTTEFPIGIARALVRVFEGADIHTLANELAHVARNVLLNRNVPEMRRMGITEQHIRIAEEWSGAKNGIWTVEAEEKFARGFERYLYDGYAPNDSLKAVFERIKRWFGRIYAKLEGSEIDIEISPEMRSVYDAIVTRKSRLQASRESLLDVGATRTEAHRAAKVAVAASEGEPASELIEMNKRGIADLREKIGVEELSAPERVHFETNVRVAREAGHDKNALDIARDVLNSGRMLNADEEVGLLLKANELENFYDELTEKLNYWQGVGDTEAAKIEFKRRVEVVKQLDLLTEASDAAGTEIGRALSVRRLRMRRATYELVNVKRNAKEAKRGALAEAEEKNFEGLVKENDQLKLDLAEMEKKFSAQSAEAERLKALQQMDVEVKKAKIKQRAVQKVGDIQARREAIKKQLENLGRRQAQTLGASLGLSPAAPETAWLIGKLAATYVEQGAVTLDEVVRLVMADFPELTPRDIWRALNSRNPDLQGKAQNDALKALNRIKTTARLLEEVAQAEEGIFSPKQTRPPIPEEIKALRSKINQLRKSAFESDISAAQLDRSMRTLDALQAQLDGNYRAMKKAKGPINMTEEMALIREKIGRLRTQMRLTDKLADLEEQLRTGEFKVKETRPVIEQPPEILQLKAKIIQKQRQIDEAIDALRPMNTTDWIKEGITTFRTLLTPGDLSVTLRQLLMLVSRRAFRGDLAGLGEDFGKAVQAVFSKNKDAEIMATLESDKHHYLRVLSGLELTSPGGPLTAREEYFRANLIKKFPVLGKYLLDPIIQGSERHFRTFSNLMRADAFDKFLKANPNATQAEMKAIARAINIFSGRGDLGKAAGAADYLSLAFFAPKFSYSRVQTPFVWANAMNSPRTRREIVKYYLSTLAFGTTMLEMAHLAGFEVGLDPESSDWGKIKIGNTRYDIWGGFQQPMRVIFGAANSILEEQGVMDKDQEKPVDFLNSAWRFASYKLAPHVTLGYSLAYGKNIIGQKVTPTDALLNSVMPLVYQDIRDIWKSEGATQAALSIPPVILGIGANTYEKKKRKGGESWTW